MHRFFAGACQIHLRLTPDGPWMVRGQTEQEPFRDSRGQPGRRDVLFPLLDEQRRPVLPASSLKGVLRSTAERILRSIETLRSANVDRAPLADDPFVHTEGRSQEEYDDWLAQQPRVQIADSELLEWMQARKQAPPTPEAIYPLLSAATQLFGATTYAGLVTLDDAHAPAKATLRRSHVAIDRFTGGVGEGPFLEELAAAAPLETTLTVANFALWQIGLLALVFQEMNRGYVAVGGGTRKGQGRVRVEATQIVFQYAHRDAQETGIVSAQARLAGPPWNIAPDLLAYGIAAEHDLVLLPDLRPRPRASWRDDGLHTLQVSAEQAEALFTAAVEQAWRGWVEQMKEDRR